MVLFATNSHNSFKHTVKSLDGVFVCVVSLDSYETSSKENVMTTPQSKCPHTKLSDGTCAVPCQFSPEAIEKTFEQLAKKFPYIVKWESGSPGWAVAQLRIADATDAPFNAIYYRKGETGEHVVNGWHTTSGTTNPSMLTRMGIEIPVGLNAYQQVRSIIHDLMFGLKEMETLNKGIGRNFDGIVKKMSSDLDFYRNVEGRMKSTGLIKVITPEDRTEMIGSDGVRCECPENENHPGECDRFGKVRNPHCFCH